MDEFFRAILAAHSAEGDRLFRVKPIASSPEGDHASERSDVLCCVDYTSRVDLSAILH